MSDPTIPGIHHITALSGPAQNTLDFYVGVLGLRRVKTTVNFDDPKTHHLYFGDRVGRPGTLLTFFPWSQTRPGRMGAGMVSTVAFAVPQSTLDDWEARLAASDASPQWAERFGDPVLQFQDPAGLALEFVGTAEMDTDEVWEDGPVPAEQAVRGFHAPTLPVFPEDRTLELLTDVFGWSRTDEFEDRIRLRSAQATRGGVLDLSVRDRHASGRMGQGAVHHIAFRAADAEAQWRWQRALRERDIRVTDVKDRQYFQSIYFRDPDWTSGILFEIATDGPGFLTDESEGRLGGRLQLPPWLETQRDEIEDALPSLAAPTGAR